jgi:hypothetical protein
MSFPIISPSKKWSDKGSKRDYVFPHLKSGRTKGLKGSMCFPIYKKVVGQKDAVLILPW